jgi:hypothetical protein
MNGPFPPGSQETLADVLTDGPRMRPVLALLLRELGVSGSVTACHVHQVRRRVSRRTESGESHWLEVCYQLAVTDPDSGRRSDAWLCGHAGGDPRHDPGVPFVRVDGLDLKLWQLPNDPTLAQLPAFLDPAAASERFGSAVNAVRVVRYEPGEHCTARFTLGDGSARYGKLYAEAEVYARAAHAQRVLAHAGRASEVAFRVAEPLADDALHALYTAEQCGAPLTSQRADAPLQQQLALALAALRLTRIEPLPVLSPEHWLGLATKWRKKMVMAGMADPARVDALLARLQAAPAMRPVTVHGDFHADQMRIGDDGRLVLFDFDNMAIGSGCQDLADFVSQCHLTHRRPRGDGVPRHLIDVVLHDTGADEGELDWYLRLLFLRKAYSFFVHHGAGARERIADALTAAEAGQAVADAQSPLHGELR